MAAVRRRDNIICAPGIQGASAYGESYYEVKTNSQNTEIAGCYEKINSHSVHPKISHIVKYPIYKQTSGPFYLKINEDPTFSAPWTFQDEEKNIIYRYFPRYSCIFSKRNIAFLISMIL